MSGLRATCMATLLGLCAVLSACGPNRAYQERMQSADPLERACGCKAAGASGDRAAVALLIDRLNDPDPGVRFIAEQALRELTGQDFHPDPPDVRVKRWREYLDSTAGGSGGQR